MVFSVPIEIKYNEKNLKNQYFYSHTVLSTEKILVVAKLYQEVMDFCFYLNYFLEVV